MATQHELDIVYMSNAVNMAALSKAVRKKVGCVLVTPESIQIGSFNGTPSGWDNVCETEEVELVSMFGECPYFRKTGELKTLNHVIHAELNSILHAARQGVCVKGSTLYTTLSCCVQCSAMVAQAGIRRVVYKEAYRDTTGIEMLERNGIIVEQLNVDDV